MRKHTPLRFVGGACALLIVFIHSAAAQSVAGSAPQDTSRGVLSYAGYVEPALASIVGVSVKSSRTEPEVPDEFRKLFGSRSPSARESRQAGAGFIIDAERGLIVTASFLLNDAVSVTVRFDDGRQTEAEIAGRDEVTDIALLRVKDVRGLKALQWGDSNALKVGDVAFGLGQVGDLGRVVTSGIISGFARGVEQFDSRDMLMTDVAFPFGFAGGPLLDSKGRVIAVAMSIYANPSNSAISIAVTQSEAQQVVSDLAAFGRVKRASLGVMLQEESEAEPGLRGVMIAAVTKGSAADRAGLRAEDVIVQAAGEPIHSSSDLVRLIRRLAPGSSLDLAYERSGSRKSATVTLGETGE
ncbi:S1-C subfamily serine protease [Povalibacter uvarum]|uniref:S1-C subfamily serine protease n=1 Tax=Povalibacter uvarum TaxID=732238 RepID=A0A841HWY4_9GAMM|nr:S1-C subfamily serine protease [Povalibacter uvarum]